MRKTIKTVIFLIPAMLLVATSCRVVDSDDMLDRDIVEEGYYVYEVTARNVLMPMLQILDYTLKADRYLKADDVYEQYYIRRELFDGMDITMNRTDDSGTLRLNGYECIIEFSGESILTPGAEWVCKAYNNTVHMLCTAADTWALTLEDGAGPAGSGRTIESLSFTAFSPDVHKLDAPDPEAVGQDLELTYILEASGSFSETGMVKDVKTLTNVDFSTLQPTHAFINSHVGFYNGGFRLHLLTKGVEERDEDIEVTLSESKVETRVYVTYKGKSSYWVTNGI